MEKREIYGMVQNATFEACNVYVYGTLINSNFTNCTVVPDKQAEYATSNFVRVDSEKLRECKLRIRDLKKELESCRRVNKSLKEENERAKGDKVVIYQLQSKIGELVRQKKELRVERQRALEKRISDLEDKVNVLLEVNHSQAKRIIELEHTHDNNFDENWEFYPPKRVIESLSRVLETWLDCEE